MKKKNMLTFKLQWDNNDELSLLEGICYQLGYSGKMHLCLSANWRDNMMKCGLYLKLYTQEKIVNILRNSDFRICGSNSLKVFFLQRPWLQELIEPRYLGLWCFVVKKNRNYYLTDVSLSKLTNQSNK